MIERFLEKLIEELGATGILVIGLYFVLGRPLFVIAKHMTIINEEIGQIIQLIKDRK